MRVFLEGDPPKSTAQQKGVNFKRRAIYTKAEIEAHKRWYRDKLKASVPEKPFTGPVEVEIIFVWPYRAEDLSNQAKREAAELAVRIPHVGKPDVDNAVKPVMDVLESLGFFTGDHHVYKLTVEKWYGARPGVSIIVLPHPGSPFKQEGGSEV